MRIDHENRIIYLPDPNDPALHNFWLKEISWLGWTCFALVCGWCVFMVDFL